MKGLECPFCGRAWVQNDISYTKESPEGPFVYETAISYIECPCGAVYAPQRLRVNQCQKDGN